MSESSTRIDTLMRADRRFMRGKFHRKVRKPRERRIAGLNFAQQRKNPARCAKLGGVVAMRSDVFA
jgi:hypothetical protein